MITLSTMTFDTKGFIEIHGTEKSDLTGVTRRVNRTATLDGKAVFNDGGFSDADRTLVIRTSDISAEKGNAISNLMKKYPIVMLSCSEGIFSGALLDFEADGDPVTFTFLVKEKLNGATIF